MYVGPWQEYRLAKLRADAVSEIKEQFRHLKFDTDGTVNDGMSAADTQRCAQQ